LEKGKGGGNAGLDQFVLLFSVLELHRKESFTSPECGPGEVDMK
jgi:hypothetical protein